MCSGAVLCERTRTGPCGGFLDTSALVRACFGPGGRRSRENRDSRLAALLREQFLFGGRIAQVAVAKPKAGFGLGKRSNLAFCNSAYCTPNL